MKQYVYMLGVGGMGMAPLAKFLHLQGYYVYGWDDFASDTRKQSLQTFIQWSVNVPAECAICVYSSAIDASHPQLLEAKKHCTCMTRGAFLAQITKEKPLWVVCGSHGKSTTAAYLIHFFQRHNLPVNYLLGAEFQQDRYAPCHYTPDALGTLIELDESDGTIDLFDPQLSIILNTDWDHPHHYPSEEAYKNVFNHLANRTTNFVITNEPVSTPAIKLCIPKALEGPDFDKAAASVAFETLFHIKLNPADHATFPGLKRRQEILLKTKHLELLSDYAHHPTELKVLFQKWIVDKTRTYVVFEPHRTSRLHQFFEAFVKVLRPVQHLYLLPTYEAFEPHQTAQDLFQALPHAQAFEQLKPSNFVTTEPTRIIFVGAGNVDRLAKQWMKEWIEAVINFLGNPSCIQKNFSLKTSSTMHIGGSALFASFPESETDLIQLLQKCHQLGLPAYPIGSGSNLLIPEECYNGVVIFLKKHCWKHIKSLDSNVYEVGSGCFLQTFLNHMEQAGTGGFEFLDGIPGTIGGALSMNAGTHDWGILDRIEKITCLDKTGQKLELFHKDLTYNYRSCESLKDKIILSVVLKGTASTSEEMQAIRQSLKKKRRASQPVGHSLGCFFKNTLAGSTGKLLDELGLKNTRRGNVKVSSTHANFIINEGNGTFKDVVDLARTLRSIVYEKKGIWLEPEARILGKFWDEFL